jgi:hypothetical protein
MDDGAGGRGAKASTAIAGWVAEGRGKREQGGPCDGVTELVARNYLRNREFPEFAEG